MRNKKNVTRLAAAAIAIAGAAAGVALLGNSSASADASNPERDAVMAQEQRISDCMAARGFKYVVAVPNDLILDDAYTAATAAGKSGDALQAAMDHARAALPADPNDAVVNALTDAQQAAWNDALSGTDTTQGCSDPSVAMSAAAVSDIDADSAKADAADATAAQTATVQQARTAYATCMNGKGYSSADPDTFEANLTEQTESERTAPENWPTPPPTSSSPQQVAAYAVKMAGLNVIEQVADDELAKGQAAHEGCFVPYEKVYESAYDAALANS